MISLCRLSVTTCRVSSSVFFIKPYGLIRPVEWALRDLRFNTLIALLGVDGDTETGLALEYKSSDTALDVFIGIDTTPHIADGDFAHIVRLSLESATHCDHALLGSERIKKTLEIAVIVINNLCHSLKIYSFADQSLHSAIAVRDNVCHRVFIAAQLLHTPVLLNRVRVAYVKLGAVIGKMFADFFATATARFHTLGPYSAIFCVSGCFLSEAIAVAGGLQQD